MASNEFEASESSSMREHSRCPSPSICRKASAFSELCTLHTRYAAGSSNSNCAVQPRSSKRASRLPRMACIAASRNSLRRAMYHHDSLSLRSSSNSACCFIAGHVTDGNQIVRDRTEFHSRLCLCFDVMGLYRSTEIFERQLQPGEQVDFRLPAQQGARLGNVGTALARIVLRQRLEADGAFRSCQLQHQAGALQYGEFVRIADVDWQVFVRARECQNALNLVAHEAKAACLQAVAIDCERLAQQCLLHEVGDHAPIVDLQPRPVCIKDANDTRVHVMVAAIGHGCGLGKALGLVVHRPWADGIHVSPITLFLRMFQRIAVALRGRSQQELRVVLLCQFKTVDCARRSDLQSFDTMLV